MCVAIIPPGDASAGSIDFRPHALLRMSLFLAYLLRDIALFYDIWFSSFDLFRLFVFSH